MDKLFELNILEDEVIYEGYEYETFSLNLEMLEGLLNNELFTEAIKGNPQKVSKTVKDATVKAKMGTRDAFEVYDNITDAGGSLIDAVYQLTVNSLRLISKIIKFILTNLSKIPMALAKIIKKLSNLPDEIKSKIKGNMDLYITIGDLSTLKDEIMGYVKDFLTLATSFTSEGDYRKQTIGLFKFNEGDFKTYDKMNDIYKRIRNIKFEKTSILLNNKEVINTYLSSDSNYYVGLNEVIKAMNESKSDLEKLEKMAETKFNANQVKGVVAKLSPNDQLKAKKSIEMISKMIEITGNIMKYVIADIATIDRSLNSVIKKRKFDD